jgi:virginiamycin A acetyltransferase
MFANLFFRLKRFKKALGTFKSLYYNFDKQKLGYCGKNVIIDLPVKIDHPENVYLYDDASIYECCRILSNGGKFNMGKHSGAAQGLTVVTGNHKSEVGSFIKDCMRNNFDEERDVIIDEDVWIGTNVTLLSGVHVGRGATIGAGSVCRKSIPPYSIVIGNPAKIVGFKFTPEQIIEHEKKLYNESERLQLDKLERNYDKYFINRIKGIKQFMKQ